MRGFAQMLQLATDGPPVFKDRWTVLGTIDDTGSACDYLVWDRGEERWCMLRMLSFQSSRDSLARGRFEREMRLLERLDHPNVMSVYETDPIHPIHPWAVLDVAEGGALSDWLAAHGQMPTYLAIDVMSQVCSALSHSHTEGASHGSLRPQSVLIDRLGACKVLGFRGSGERSEMQADVRQAGGLLYVLLTGRAWDDGRAAELLGGLPTSIARVIEQTNKQRGGYADISSFSRELEAAVLDLPMPSGAVPPLAGPDVALPTDPMELWVPGTVFEDLIHHAGRVADPHYEIPVEVTPVAAFPPAGSTGPVAHEPSAPPPASEPQAPAALPYTMSRGDRRSFDASAYERDGQPLYEDDAPPEQEAWDPWDADVAPEPEDVEEEEVEPEPLLSDKVLGRMVVLAGLFLLAAVVGSVGYGAHLVSIARAEATVAGSQLIEAVRGDSAIVYDLAASGVAKNELERHYFAFDEARSDRRRLSAALDFVAEVEVQAKAAGLEDASPEAGAYALTNRVDRVRQARLRYLGKRDVWQERSDGFPGWVAVLIRIQAGPPS